MPGRRDLVGLTLAAVMLAACGDDNGQSNSNTNVNTNYNTNANTNVNALDSGCPGRLDPVALAGEQVVVGDGTAGSCTEVGLQTAVATTNAAPNGGSITFDCGGEHTISLTGPLLVTAPLIVDGEHRITLSGGNTTRIFDLDHYTEFVVQRITLTQAETVESGAAIHHP